MKIHLLIITLFACKIIIAQPVSDTISSNSRLIQPIYIQNIKGPETEKSWIEKYGTLILFAGTLLTLVASILNTNSINKQNAVNVQNTLEANRTNMARQLRISLATTTEREWLTNIRNELAIFIRTGNHLVDLICQDVGTSEVVLWEIKTEMVNAQIMLDLLLDRNIPIHRELFDALVAQINYTATDNLDREEYRKLTRNTVAKTHTLINFYKEALLNT